MASVDELQRFGQAFWREERALTARARAGRRVRLRHPGLYEPLDVPAAELAALPIAQTAELAACQLTGRAGYVSPFAREVLVRPANGLQALGMAMAAKLAEMGVEM